MAWAACASKAGKRPEIKLPAYATHAIVSRILGFVGLPAIRLASVCPERAVFTESTNSLSAGESGGVWTTSVPGKYYDQGREKQRLS
ncbi:MAG: hypothetical protein ACI9W2_003544 [Gammaproteobacteria bacterium]|jgi:hypothetical protein